MILFFLTNSSVNGRPHKKHKRPRLTRAEQVEAETLFKSGTNASVVMCQFGISRRTATNTYQKCDETMSRAHENEISFNLRTIRAVAFLEIDDGLLQFVSLERRIKFPGTQSFLTNRALLVRERLLKSSNVID